MSGYYFGPIPKTIFPVAGQSATKSASFNSEAFEFAKFSRACISAKTAGAASLNVSLKLQASNNGSDWADITGTAQALTTDTTHIWNIDGAGYPFLRVAATFTAGSADFTITGFAKP